MPATIVRAGNVRISVHKNGGRYAVAWRPFAGARRSRETFPTRSAAIARAREIASAIANGQGDAVTLTAATRDDYRLAVQSLPPGIHLHTAIEEYTAARALIPGHTLREAAAHFAAHSNTRPCPPTAAIVEDLLSVLRDNRRSEAFTIRPLENDLRRFASAFPSMASATEPSIRAYLRGRTTKNASGDKPAGSPVSPRRRDNILAFIIQLFRHAVTRQHIPPGITAPERIAWISESAATVTTFNAPQLAALLTFFHDHDREWLPWAALAAFAGLRTSEIFRLQWSAAKWHQDSIAISGMVARKTRVSRHAPLLPVLRAWLAPWRNATGNVISARATEIQTARAHSPALRRACRSLGWARWPINVLRHSFGSHRLAITKNIAQVALEMGNSPAMVREHYNDSKPEDESAAWFSVTPSPAGNIIQLG